MEGRSPPPGLVGLFPVCVRWSQGRLCVAELAESLSLLGTSGGCDPPHRHISPSQQLPNPPGHGGPRSRSPSTQGSRGCRSELGPGQRETRWLPGTFAARLEGGTDGKEKLDPPLPRSCWSSWFLLLGDGVDGSSLRLASQALPRCALRNALPPHQVPPRGRTIGHACQRRVGAPVSSQPCQENVLAKFWIFANLTDGFVGAESVWKGRVRVGREGWLLSRGVSAGGLPGCLDPCLTAMGRPGWMVE
nr:PREDICTED: uncharacterized protein LOC103560182 [Equus przewalskii]